MLSKDFLLSYRRKIRKNSGFNHKLRFSTVHKCVFSSSLHLNTHCWPPGACVWSTCHKVFLTPLLSRNEFVFRAWTRFSVFTLVPAHKSWQLLLHILRFFPLNFSLNDNRSSSEMKTRVKARSSALFGLSGLQGSDMPGVMGHRMIRLELWCEFLQLKNEMGIGVLPGSPALFKRLSLQFLLKAIRR